MSGRQLLQALQTGMGAVKIGTDVKRIKLTMDRRCSSFATRHFRKEFLPKLKYNNPQILFQLQVTPEACEPNLEIELSSGVKVMRITQDNGYDVCYDLLDSLNSK
ncbi:hypothetical protein DSO57_1039396 [Entomophthora muscae]|uniref:Uncharacterized protein n=2 Tax=Entomophthora muscae TaxID=34485 RepID=A0ACC2U253_9FUNG|nr:hypothetical protein DSO57_1020566 [Entomophthora muscae]KAJ9082967.1 hypothetical protein DSO57_1039396 [Entomophthora muscae]